MVFVTFAFTRSLLSSRIVSPSAMSSSDSSATVPGCVGASVACGVLDATFGDSLGADGPCGGPPLCAHAPPAVGGELAGDQLQKKPSSLSDSCCEHDCQVSTVLTCTP